jgi:hypothetical protein
LVFLIHTELRCTVNHTLDIHTELRYTVNHTSDIHDQVIPNKSNAAFPHLTKLAWSSQKAGVITSLSNSLGQTSELAAAGHSRWNHTWPVSNMWWQVGEFIVGWCRFSVPDMHAAGVYWAAGFYKQPGVVGGCTWHQETPCVCIIKTNRLMLWRKIPEFYWGKPSGQMQPVQLRMTHKDTDIKYGLNDKQMRVRFPAWAEVSVFSETSRAILRLTHPPAQMVQTALCCGKNSQGVKLASHLNWVPRLRIGGTVPPFPNHLFKS